MSNRAWLALGLLSAVAAWFYVRSVLNPWERHVYVESGIVRAQMGDLYSPWVGARELLLHGQNPYGRQVSDEIQMGVYGRRIEQSYGGPKVIDEQRFAYPVYLVFLIAPIAYLDFPPAQIGMCVILAALTSASILLWMDFLGWKPQKTLAGAIVLLILASPQVVQGLRLRQLGLAVGFLMAVGVWCIARNRLTLAGIALALATIKPQMIVLPLAWLILWGAKSWPDRSRLLTAFGGALAVLVALGEIVLPGWLHFFLRGLVAYSKYNPVSSLACIAVGERFGIAVSALMLFATLVVGWRNRGAEAASPRFNRTLVAFLVCGSLILPQVAEYNQVLLLLPVLIIARDWKRYPVTLRRAVTLLVPWLWLIYPALLLFRLPINSTARFPLLPSALALFLPFLLLAVLAVSPGADQY
jgi:hypothetical protein